MCEKTYFPFLKRQAMGMKYFAVVLSGVLQCGHGQGGDDGHSMSTAGPALSHSAVAESRMSPCLFLSVFLWSVFLCRCIFLVFVCLCLCLFQSNSMSTLP